MDLTLIIFSAPSIADSYLCVIANLLVLSLKCFVRVICLKVEPVASGLLKAILNNSQST